MKKEVKEYRTSKIEQYTIEGYKIKEVYYKDKEGNFFNGGRIDRIEVERPGRKFVPEIFVDLNLFSEEFEIIDIYIQTTSYGSLPVGEIEKIVKGYQKANRVTKKLKEIYKGYIVE